jgi:DNA-binding response OmpR family regulator
MSRAMADHRVDLIILDVMLPGEDGLTLCRKVRSEAQTPIIMLTARGEDVDRIVGLEMGADDYVVKPFSLRELQARIRAHLRRVELSSRERDQEEVLQVERIRVDVRSRSVERDGHMIHLLPREFDLLLHLMRNRGIVLSRNQILEKVWGPDYLGDARTVDVHIRRLRLKIEPNPDDPTYVRTIYGIGYTFRAEREG